ncbi:MAG: spore coat protein [Clostridia bacterium]|nr:spore coat protein [Clostridia bacterium]
MDTQMTVTSKSGVVKIGKQVTSELPKVKDATVNVRDRVNDILATEKHNLINYQTAINEAISDEFRQILINGRNDTQNLHTRVFGELFNMGEYQADVATTQQLADTVEVFTNYKSQLPYSQ